MRRISSTAIAPVVRAAANNWAAFGRLPGLVRWRFMQVCVRNIDGLPTRSGAKELQRVQIKHTDGTVFGHQHAGNFHDLQGPVHALA